MTGLIIDTETTGVDEPEVVEVAIAAFDLGSTDAGALHVRRFRPSKAISLGALATHHIMDEDLADYPPSSSFKLPEGTTHIIGYNVDFDWRAIGEPDVKRIDVLAMCRFLWPTLDSHTQGAMVYFLFRRDAREWLRQAHSAGADVQICALILQRVIEMHGGPPFATFDDLWQYSERARIPKIISFGKHKGTPIADLPRDYRQWMLKQADMDEYVLKAVRASLYAHN